jgi:carbonic anhydrase/acetyltransferase-like protein (isoleucine patch superfamily)
MLYQLDDLQIQLEGQGHFVAENAVVIGNVLLQDSVNIWFNVVIRGDNELMTIGARTNIQDAAVLHSDPGFPLTIAEDVTVGHKAMLHGCSIGAGSLIGINAVVLNGAKVGKGCIIGAGALVTEGMEIPDGAMVMGVPAKVRRNLSDEERQGLLASAAHYVENGQRYLKGLKRQWQSEEG